MAVCDQVVDVGKSLVASWAPACGDADHTALPYTPFGSTNSKSLNESSTESSTTSDDSGAEEGAIITRLTAEITVGGFNTLKDTVKSSQKALRAYRRTEVQAGRQPTIWLKLLETNGLDVIYVYCLFLGNTRTYGTDDADTGDFNFKMISTDVAGKPAWIEAAKA